MPTERELRFPISDAKYSPNLETVVFWGIDGDARIRCQISREALEDHFGGDGKDKLAIFTANTPAIEAIARQKYIAGHIEPDGSVLVRTGDV